MPACLLSLFIFSGIWRQNNILHLCFHPACLHIFLSPPPSVLATFGFPSLHSCPKGYINEACDVLRKARGSFMSKGGFKSMFLSQCVCLSLFGYLFSVFSPSTETLRAIEKRAFKINMNQVCMCYLQGDIKSVFITLFVPHCYIGSSVFLTTKKKDQQFKYEVLILW